MRGIVLEHAGPPEVLEIRDVPRSRSKPLDSTAPNYLRARGIHPVSPFRASWVLNALGLSKPLQAPACRSDKPLPQ
jgi:hypothetical protein